MSILRATPEFLPPEVVVAEELIDAYLEEEKASGYYIYIAEHEGEIAGYVCYGDTPLTEATWDLYWIAVHHDKQGFGIGRILMKHAEEDIKRMHGKLIMVETSGKADYNKTRQFYERLNYKKLCQITDYYAPGDDLVLFAKRI
jgi:GNAT superfamily N-acetyltransferase